MSGETLSGHPNPPRRKSLPPWSWPVLVSALAWAVIFLALPPAQQDFPMGDDWAFARGAIWFAHGQGVHYSNWASMPQLGQWIWAWPFLHVIPWTHVALRLSVIVLSWLALAAFCDLLQRSGIPSALAAFAACVLALNPLFFMSQGSFMTDVPALSFALLALDFYARAMDGKNHRWLFAATMAAVFACVTRQTMIAVPLAAAVPLLRNPELRRKPIWGVSLLVPLALCLLVNQWFSHRTDVLVMRPELTLTHLYFRPFLALHWCGLAVVPLCLLRFRQRNWAVFFAGLSFMLAFVFYLSDKPLPYGGSFPYSVGMVSLEGTYSDGLVVGDRDVLLTSTVRFWITILGCVGAADILAALWQTLKAKTFPGMLMVFTLLQFLITLTVPVIMDRYFEALFPGALLLVAAQQPAIRKISRAAIAATALIGLICVALVHDVLSWNVARWELGRQAIAEKNLQPFDIEGGFEWNGWYASADPDHPLLSARPLARGDDAASLTLPFSRHYFPMVTGRFALAFTQPTNSVVVAKLPYSQWLPPATKEFLFIEEKSNVK